VQVVQIVALVVLRSPVSSLAAVRSGLLPTQPQAVAHSAQVHYTMYSSV
jgi:hypothetical protein